MAGQPLVLREIQPFMQAVLRQSASPGKHTVNIGVCISGGPDSMALAYLLRQLEQQGLGERRVCLTGLIVDHQARPESTDEAKRVQRNLTRIGISSTILSMQWPRGLQPLQLSDFESQARLMRYRLLAREALDRCIHHLFLGHHQDDQIETVIMRLIRNHTFSLSGLLGMASSAPIPGCDDIFGAHVEGPGFAVSASAPFPQALPKAKIPIRSGAQRNTHRIMSKGGIFLHRPLLPFSKADLVATCEANNVPYVIDPTNKDPQTSVRNAIRHLNTHYKLPVALGRARVLRLLQKALDHFKRVEVAGNAILSRCQILSLDVRSGTLTVYIPYQDCQTYNDTQPCAYAIAKLIEVVEPVPRTSQSVQIPLPVLSHFFGGPGIPRVDDSTNASHKPFTQGKVYVVPHPDRPRTWTFGRQPMTKAEIMNNTRHFWPDDKSDSSTTGVRESQSDFLLWDNRFWIRISMSDLDTLKKIIVRPFRESDVSEISRPFRPGEGNEKSGRDKLPSLLREAAPGKTKFTLPVLTYEDRVVAFPTLDRKLHGACHELGLQSLSWDVRYNSFSLFDNWVKSPSASTAV